MAGNTAYITTGTIMGGTNVPAQCTATYIILSPTNQIVLSSDFGNIAVPVSYGDDANAVLAKLQTAIRASLAQNFPSVTFSNVVIL